MDTSSMVNGGRPLIQYPIINPVFVDIISIQLSHLTLHCRSTPSLFTDMPPDTSKTRTWIIRATCLLYLPRKYDTLTEPQTLLLY